MNNSGQHKQSVNTSRGLRDKQVCKLPFSLLHKVDGIIDRLQGHGVGYELIQLHLLIQVGLYHLWHIMFTFET